jgi:hypothetical protein
MGAQGQSEPEERVGRKYHILLRELHHIQPRARQAAPPDKGTETLGPQGSKSGLELPWTYVHARAHTHTHTHTPLHTHACTASTRGTDALPRGLLTMVTEWPPLGSSHHLKVSEAPCAGGGSSNKGTAQDSLAGGPHSRPAGACLPRSPSELGPPRLPTQPAWLHLAQLPTDSPAELMRNSPAGPI